MNFPTTLGAKVANTQGKFCDEMSFVKYQRVKEFHMLTRVL